LVALEVELMDNDAITIGYRPRKHFRPFHASKKRWRYVVAHRRAGKSVAFINDLIRAALQNSRDIPVPRYAYVGPTFAQAKDLVWNYIKQYTKDLPGVTYSESELTCRLPNRAQITLYGGGQAYNRIRGLYLDGAVLDEYPLINPEALNSVIRPALADYQGFGVVAGTPAGRDHFFDQKVQAERNPDLWDVFNVPVTETDALDPDELSEMQRTMTPHQFEREMMCSFEAPVENSYFGDLMVQARMDGRLTKVPADPRLRTITAWDLGMKDLTTIWFAQKVGQEIRFVDFYQSSGKGLDHYARVLQERGYLYGYHLFPHDIKVREFGTGRSRFETILSLQLPGDALIVPDHAVADGISGVRSVIPISWFDEEKCELGIDALRSYHVQMAPSGATVRDAPAHTWASHAADAMRYFAMGLHLTTAWGPGAFKRNAKGIV
jgi:phage terminase large subunit